MYSDYVVIVEGPSDKIIIEQFLKRGHDLEELLNASFLTVRSIGGVNNLRNEIYNLEHYMCRYIAVLDNDEAGKNAARDVQQQLDVDSDRFRYFIVNGIRSKSELEDLYKPGAYQDILRQNFAINISVPSFKNKSKKWCTRIEEIAAVSGRVLSEEELNSMKRTLSESACAGNVEDWFSERGIALLSDICDNIKSEIFRLLSRL